MSGLRGFSTVRRCAREIDGIDKSFRLPKTGQKVHYRLRVSRRARHLRLEISPNQGLTVILPHRAPGSEVERLLAQKEDWILKHLKKIGTSPPRKITLKDGSTIPYKGIPHKVVLRPHTRSFFSVQLQSRTLLIQVPPVEQAPVNAVLESWFRWQAKIQIEQLVRQLARRYNLRPGRISIRDQKTRWGSCSSKGNLNFNWRLLMAPIGVLRYVVIHELTHLNELNHSKKFWALLADRCPDFREHEAWLKEHGAELRRF